MENEFHLKQQNLHSYFNNNNNNNNSTTDSNNWNSSFTSSLASSVHPSQAPLISTDPAFAERAARFSMFGSRSFNGRIFVDEGELELGFPRVSSCQGLKLPSPANGSGFLEIKEGIRFHDEVKMNEFSPENGEESSVSEPQKSTSRNDLNPRKRKSNPRAKKEIKNNQIQHEAKKSDESNGTENSGGKARGKSKDDSRNTAEPPKDYIHVRARRGQATDSHSLAERVRREKISQRMKFLQDLVPGCSKVTGKAVMLDEIINYVQSLQHQVEFLSMKLSTVNPTADINMESLLSKDLHQARSGLLSESMFALESSSPLSPAFPYGYPSSHGSLVKKNAHSDESESSFSMSPLPAQRPNHVVQLPPSMDGYDQSASQVSMWIDELHNVVQMGYIQNELQNFQASLTTSDMKMEQ